MSRITPLTFHLQPYAFNLYTFILFKMQRVRLGSSGDQAHGDHGICFDTKGFYRVFSTYMAQSAG